jgi:hypothetical protein
LSATERCTKTHAAAAESRTPPAVDAAFLPCGPTLLRLTRTDKITDYDLSLLRGR